MFEWDGFLLLAERLVREGNDESAQRTAISRAYYAAYHAAAAYVRATGTLPHGHTHQRVWTSLEKSTELADVAAYGGVLRRLRIEADYRGRFPGDVGEQAQTSIGLARDVIEALRRVA